MRLALCQLFTAYCLLLSASFRQRRISLRLSLLFYCFLLTASCFLPPAYWFIVLLSQG